MLRRIFLLGTPLFLARIARAASKTCDLCGKTIHGKYYEHRGPHGTKVFCTDCYRNSPKCSLCGMPCARGTLIKVGGQLICPSCHANAKFCALCGKVITGRYYASERTDEVFCENCYKTYPRCRACDRPMRRSDLTADGVCADCAARLPKCKACGKTIVGAYFVHQFKGEYCWECQRSRPECHACGAPVGDIYWKLPDGRVLCQECKNQSVFREAQMQQIMKDVIRIVKDRLGLVVKRPWTLRLDRLNTEGKASVEAARMGLKIASPITGNEMGVYIERDNKREIVLLYGLPIPMVFETAAHELAHAWQAENCPAKQDIELREGFAQWVAAKVLKYKQFDVTLEKLQARMDHPYGTGYHRMARIEAMRGETGVIQYVRTAVR